MYEIINYLHLIDFFLYMQEKCTSPMDPMGENHNPIWGD